MGTYGISCADCMLSDWQYETRTQAEKAQEAHRHDNGCRGFLIDVVHTDVELLNTNDDQPLIDPNNPPLDEQFDDESYDIPAGIGYRLAGNRPLRALIGPGGTQLTPKASEITIVEPGTAIVKITLHNETVHWQPDLREVDAWERQPGTNTVSSYGEDGHPLPTHDYRSEKAIH